jgi:hypothetical protein
MPVLTSGVSDLIPAGEIVQAKLMDVEEREFTYKDELVQKLRWHFIVTEEGPWQQKVITGETSRAFTPHPNCRAYQWAVNIVGHKFEEGESLDTGDLLGLPCKIVIEHRPDKQGRTWMNVGEVFPNRQAAQRPVPSIDESPF